MASSNEIKQQNEMSYQPEHHAHSLISQRQNCTWYDSMKSRACDMMKYRILFSEERANTSTSLCHRAVRTAPKASCSLTTIPVQVRTIRFLSMSAVRNRKMLLRVESTFLVYPVCYPQKQWNAACTASSTSSSWGQVYIVALLWQCSTEASRCGMHVTISTQRLPSKIGVRGVTIHFVSFIVLTLFHSFRHVVEDEFERVWTPTPVSDGMMVLCAQEWGWHIVMTR